jgi:phage-related protein
MPTGTLKPIRWVGSSLRDLKAFPAEVRSDVGYALYAAQNGEMDPSAKPMKGFGGASVMEIVAPFSGDTWRAVYTVRFQDVVYVLHAFQKKSKSAGPRHRRSWSRFDSVLWPPKETTKRGQHQNEDQA